LYLETKPMNDFLPPDRNAYGKRASQLVILLLMGSTLTSCGPKPPFDLTAVEGKVTYDDGSLIQADKLLVKFFPQGIQIKGKDAPRASETYADVSDGTFSDLTTWKYADGVMVGHHKVVVISLREGSHSAGDPTRVVPLRYQQEDTTPLEVEVKARDNNHFTLEIERNPDSS
jgi:hypothetical protein